MLSTIAQAGVIVGGLALAFGGAYAIKEALYPSVLDAKPSLADKDGNAVRIPESRRSPDDDLWEFKDDNGVWQPYESTVLLRKHHQDSLKVLESQAQPRTSVNTTCNGFGITPATRHTSVNGTYQG